MVAVLDIVHQGLDQGGATGGAVTCRNSGFAGRFFLRQPFVVDDFLPAKKAREEGPFALGGRVRNWHCRGPLASIRKPLAWLAVAQFGGLACTCPGAAVRVKVVDGVSVHLVDELIRSIFRNAFVLCHCGYSNRGVPPAFDVDCLDNPMDITNPRLLKIKGLLFLLLGLISAGLLLAGAFEWRNLVLLAIVVWAFCRFYYFAFYVLQHYADPSFKYSGLLDLAKYLLRGNRSE